MTKWKEFSKRLKNIEDTTKDQIKNQLKPIEIDVNSANKNIFRKLGFWINKVLKQKKYLIKLKDRQWKRLHKTHLCMCQCKDLRS